MRWFLLVLALIGFALAFTTKSAAVLGLSLVAGFGGLVGFAFILAADRVAASMRPDSAMASIEDLAALGKTRRTAPKSPGESAPNDPQG
ncbi:hypothetical protein [Dokdonella sp.]|uniref:hypothetical protein n=1 Tax=Dokdonella sp. TaxID=2291710 RepID=UPI0026207815|nr:hypothetical protein [Dokdonella sp.]